MFAKAVGCVASGVATTVVTTLTLRLCVWLAGGEVGEPGAGVIVAVSLLLGVSVSAAAANNTKPEQWRLPRLGWPKKERSHDDV